MRCIPEVAELQGRLVHDADEHVSLLLALPRESGLHHVEVCAAQTAEGRVLRSLGSEQNQPPSGS